jgi:cytosine/uracil/thiamine/allantoin permease
VDLASLLNREPGRIAIAIPFQASRVIPSVLGVRQHLGFTGSQFGIVTSLLPVLARGKVALVF